MGSNAKVRSSWVRVAPLLLAPPLALPLAQLAALCSLAFATDATISHGQSAIPVSSDSYEFFTTIGKDVPIAAVAFFGSCVSSKEFDVLRL